MRKLIPDEVNGAQEGEVIFDWIKASYNRDYYIIIFQTESFFGISFRSGFESFGIDTERDDLDLVRRNDPFTGEFFGKFGGIGEDLVNAERGDCVLVEIEGIPWAMGGSDDGNLQKPSRNPGVDCKVEMVKMDKIWFDPFGKLQEAIDTKGGHPRDKEGSYEVARKREDGYRYFEAFEHTHELPLFWDDNMGGETISVKIFKE